MEFNNTLDYEDSPLRISYASFGRRFGAHVIDNVLLFFLSMLLLFGFFRSMLGSFQELADNPELIEEDPTAIVGIVLFIYIGIPLLITILRAIMESSSWQATPGKRMLGLKVVNNYGEPITFWRAMGRNAGKFVSAIIIYVGFLMPLWTKKKQALHDLMSDCLVAESNHDAADYTV